MAAAISALVTGRVREVDGPGRSVSAQGRPAPRLERHPAHPLAPGAQPAPDEEAEGEAMRAAARRRPAPAVRRKTVRTPASTAGGRPLPGDDHPGDEVVARRASLGQHGVAPVAVVADARRTAAPGGWAWPPACGPPARCRSSGSRGSPACGGPSNACRRCPRPRGGRRRRSRPGRRGRGDRLPGPSGSRRGRRSAAAPGVARCARRRRGPARWPCRGPRP